MDTAYFAAPFPVRAIPRTRTFTTPTSTATASPAPTDACCTRWPARPAPHPSTGRQDPRRHRPVAAIR